MRSALALSIALGLVIGCEPDEPERATVDISADPSTAADAASTGVLPPVADGSTRSGVDFLPGTSRGGNGGNDPGGFDASALLPPPASENKSDAGFDPYACGTNNDCAIRNVGNCCGVFPRCTNSNAVFPPPSCSPGQADVCGFPAIDSCQCQANRCVSLQAGVVVIP